MISALAEVGVWSIKSWTPTGIVLYVLWTIEALIIVGMAALMPYGDVASEPYCETCGRWPEREIPERKMGYATDPGLLKTSLEGGDMDALAQLGPVGDNAYTEIELKACQSCKQIAWLKVENVTVTLDKKGKEQTEKSEIVSNLILRADLMEKVRGLQPPAPEPGVEPPPEQS